MEFVDFLDCRTNRPHTCRISKLVLYILIIIHWNACIYFQISSWIGFGSDRWVYFNISDAYPINASLTRMYIYSFYWSTLTLTTIGETPRPENDIEFLFVIVDFIFGVLIFATIVGNVGSMITNKNASKSAFQQNMDNVKIYIQNHNVSPALEKRIISWFGYMWTHGKTTTSDERVLTQLPERLRADIAIHAHLETLKRVSIFRGCERGLLNELVLRLREVVFSPGDIVCLKGDIGKEMYIVKSGYLNVMSDDNKQTLATLSEGSVFGEVSLLNIAGNRTGNRRTANVLSKGYSSLFILSKSDLWQALSEYGDAKAELMERGKEILRQHGLLDERAAASADDDERTAEQRLRHVEQLADTMETTLARLTADVASLRRDVKQCVTARV